mmetsp:Transcript_35565/g.34609  ORF Transcript_35565/g.34609 Transcript_35565/m.34609 type:complete len:229 (+) Transcript_35565:207-893(+)
MPQQPSPLHNQIQLHLLRGLRGAPDGDHSRVCLDRGLLLRSERKIRERLSHPRLQLDLDLFLAALVYLLPVLGGGRVLPLGDGREALHPHRHALPHQRPLPRLPLPVLHLLSRHRPHRSGVGGPGAGPGHRDPPHDVAGGPERFHPRVHCRRHRRGHPMDDGLLHRVLQDLGGPRHHRHGPHRRQALHSHRSSHHQVQQGHPHDLLHKHHWALFDREGSVHGGQRLPQ